LAENRRFFLDLNGLLLVYQCWLLPENGIISVGIDYPMGLIAKGGMKKNERDRVFLVDRVFVLRPLFSRGGATAGYRYAADPYRIWTYQDMNSIGDYSADWNKCFFDWPTLTCPGHPTQYQNIAISGGPLTAMDLRLKPERFVGCGQTYVGLFDSGDPSKKSGIVNLMYL